MDQRSEEDVLDVDFEKSFGVTYLNVLKNQQLRRSADLFVAPRSAQDVRFFNMRETGMDALLRETEQAEFTGVVKVSNSQLRTRGGILLLRGRAVGALRNRGRDEEGAFGPLSRPPLPTEESLNSLGSDLRHESTLVMMYPSEEELVVPFSALFVGWPVTREDNLATMNFQKYIRQWLEQKEVTAVLAFSVEGAASFSFVRQGEFVGFYETKYAWFHQSSDDADSIISSYPVSGCEVSILPPPVESDPEFGFKLSSRWES